jgi:hypothetical protein
MEPRPSPKLISTSCRSIRSFRQQLTHFIARLLFREIYFPQLSHWAWIRLLASKHPYPRQSGAFRSPASGKKQEEAVASPKGFEA